MTDIVSLILYCGIMIMSCSIGVALFWFMYSDRILSKSFEYLAIKLQEQKHSEVKKNDSRKK